MEYIKNGNVYIVRLDEGEEITERLQALITQENIKSGFVHAMGHINAFTISVYNAIINRHNELRFEGAYEICAFTGVISLLVEDKQPCCHLCMSASDYKGSVKGGRLTRAIVSSTCELYVTLTDDVINRGFNRKVSLNTLVFN